MTPRQKIELKQSERRQRVAELLGKDERDEAETAELGTLTTDLQAGETELRAAIAAEPDPDEVTTDDPPAGGDQGETREIRAIRERVNLGRYVSAAIGGRAVDGAEREYNDALGVTEGVGKFPLSLIAPEIRATTDVDGQATQANWLDRLFADTAAARLGVTFESVNPGEAAYPVVTAGPAAAQKGREESADDGAWRVSATKLDPTRNAVRVVFNNVDALRLPGLEDALRRDLTMALTEGVDRAIFVGAEDSGDNDEADITGLNAAANVVEQVITQANKVKAAESLAAFLALIDGIHAGMAEDLNVVLAVGAHNLWAGTIANAAAENQTVLAFLKANGLTCSVRGEIETATEDGDFAAFVGRSKGLAGAGVAAVWNEGELIRDPYSAAGRGDVALTLSHYWNFGLPRPTNFARVKFGA